MTTKRKPKKRQQSVLGLILGDGQLRACHVARGKGGTEVVKATTAALSLDVLHPEPELVGREIKNHLDAAGIRERNCVVALPAAWVMSQHTAVPELSDADADSFLEMEAEKGFPCDPSQLQIARSFQRAGSASYVTQLAVRKEQIEQLSAVLKAAGLKPVSFTLGLASQPGVIPPAGQGRITVAVEPKGAALLIAAGGGIAALRTSESAIDSEAGENVINGAALARELRITFEQIPADLRAEVKQLVLCGDDTMCRHLAERLTGWAEVEGLKVSRAGLGDRPLVEQIAESVAKGCVEGTDADLEFLPPRPSRWAQFMARYSSKRLASTGFALGGVAVLALGFFAWQEYSRWALRSEWEEMAAKVKDFDATGDKIREFRSWYDESFRNLTILNRITECFPERGDVTARSVEIHGTGTQAINTGVLTINISGTARDYPSLLRTVDALGKIKEVKAVKIDQVRGKNPVQQFTFSFRWVPNSGT